MRVPPPQARCPLPPPPHPPHLCLVVRCEPELDGHEQLALQLGLEAVGQALQQRLGLLSLGGVVVAAAAGCCNAAASS
jgi:hypothetical protein